MARAASGKTTFVTPILEQRTLISTKHYYPPIKIDLYSIDSYINLKVQ